MTALDTIGTPAQRQTLEAYLELVRVANAKVNLVSRKDIDQLREHHLAPSCLFIALMRIKAREHILDIGSGGGFPGIVCAILQPDSEFVLIDSTRKKTDFLTATVNNLGLTNVTVLWQRVESLATSEEWRETFDHTISRAVAPLTQLVEWSRPLVKAGGTVEALKGRTAVAEEIALYPKTGKLYTPPNDWQWNDHLSTVAIASVQL